MIARTPLTQKAIPALIAGVAFFLSCQPKGPAPVKVEPVKIDRFAEAEAYQHEDQLKAALASYRAFLQHRPRDKRVCLALDRMADIYVALKQPRKAMTTLKRMETACPTYVSMPEIRYRFITLYFQTAQYQKSMDAGRKWLARYPGHFLEKEVYMLIGDNALALKERTTAFKWWLKAKQACQDTPEKAAQLNERIHKVIGESDLTALEHMAEAATGSSYAPHIYFKMTSLYLARDDLPAARETAAALIQSTDDTAWHATGNDLLKRIQQRMAVREGVVGCLLPLTGPFALYGEAVMNGIALGAESVNARSPGQNMEIVIRDTGGDRQKTLRALEELIREEKVMAVIGPLSSKTAVASAQKAQQLGVPIITLSHKQGLPQMGDMVFRHLLTPTQEIEGLLTGAMDHIGFDRYAILYPDNPYGRFCMRLFQDKVKARGGSVTAIEAYDPEQTDFADPIQRLAHLTPPPSPDIRKKQAARWIPEKEEAAIYPQTPRPYIDFDAVFIPDSFQRVAMIAPQLAYHDVLMVRLLGTSPWQSPKLIDMAGEHIQEAMFTSGFFVHTQDRDVSQFIVQYRDYFNADPGTLAATAYDTIRLLGAVLQDGDIQTRNTLTEALIAYGDFEGVTGKTHFGPDGEAHKRPLLLTVSGERFVRDPACALTAGEGHG